VLKDIQGPPIAPVVPNFLNPATPASGGTPTPTGNFSASVPRIRMIANREIPPELVGIKPNGQLDKDAAAAFARVQAKIGVDIPNVGSYRSYAVQAALYYGPGNTTLSDGNKRFAKPGTSLHEVGLAIDVRADYAVRSDVEAAMAAEGWQHVRPGADPDHYSYLVRG
jgi:LAS superfamily LD-carboxypeptidase LdcB